MRPPLALLALCALATGGVSCSGDAPAGDPAAFCRHLSRLAEQVVAAQAGPEELADVPAARALARDIAATAAALRQDAPEDIAADARALAEVTGELAQELGDFYQAIADDPARANDPTFLSSFDPVTEERRDAIDDAGGRVRPWVDEHCDVGPDR